MAASSAAAAPPSTSPVTLGTATPTSTHDARRYARRQAIRIERERERELVKDGTRSIEVTYCLTSLGPERAGPEQLLALVRNHWHIENRLHYVRDFTYDEDRCRAYVRHLPHNLACPGEASLVPGGWSQTVWTRRVLNISTPPESRLGETW